MYGVGRLRGHYSLSQSQFFTYLQYLSLVCLTFIQEASEQIAAMLDGGMSQVLAVLQAGLNFAEHQAFVQRLAKA